MNTIPFLILLVCFVSISFAVLPGLESNLVDKFMNEIENEEDDDNRPKEI